MHGELSPGKYRETANVPFGFISPSLQKFWFAAPFPVPGWSSTRSLFEVFVVRLPDPPIPSLSYIGIPTPSGYYRLDITLIRNLDKGCREGQDTHWRSQSHPHPIRYFVVICSWFTLHFKIFNLWTHALLFYWNDLTGCKTNHWELVGSLNCKSTRHWIHLFDLPDWSVAKTL